MKLLSSVNDEVLFGGIDADRDTLLDNCFKFHDAYTKALNHDRFLILGRKGSGKTAIYRNILQKKSHDHFPLGFDFTDYPWHYHNKQKILGIPGEESFLHSWRYLILLAFAKILLNNDNSQPYSEGAEHHLAKLSRFVLDSYGTLNPDVTQVFSPQRTLRFKSNWEGSLGVFKASIASESVSMSELPTILQEVNKNILEAIIVSLNPVLNYYLCFDQLDIGFDSRSADYTNRLIGLISAAKDFGARAKQAGKRASVIVFLRDDIYDALLFEDKNKVTENYATRIEWDASNGDLTLKRVMEKRFAEVLDIPEEGAWEKVFDETKEMVGHQKKYAHILERTFLRPRDMIKFCNEVLRAYKSEGEPKENIFTNSHVTGARQVYSSYLYNELQDEIFKHHPNFKSYFELLKGLETLAFTREEFDAVWEKRKAILEDELPEVILKALFEFSIIGCYAPGGQGGGAEFIWRYKNPKALFNEAASQFKVHPGFQEYLGLKKFRRG